MATVVADFEGMDDETGIKHLEHRHTADLEEMNLRFSPEPDRKEKPRRFRSGKPIWDQFHARLHRTASTDLSHEHEETEDDDA